MSTDPSPSNPFRRKGNPAVSREAREPSISSTAIADNVPVSMISSLPILQTKPVKKVRVQSPPPLSPNDPIPYSPQSQSLRDVDPDPFDNESPDSSDGEHTKSRTSAPPNPFQRTLETIERVDNTVKEEAQKSQPTRTNPAGRASLDVEAFKRLLMTGSAGPTSPGRESTPTVSFGSPGVQSTASFGHNIASNVAANSTDTSLSSKHSLFDPVPEAPQESPRTSHEVSDGDTERDRSSLDILPSSDAAKRKPPPPSSRHGKVINPEHKDQTVGSPDSSTMSPRRTSNDGSRLLSNLDKPLPLAPLGNQVADLDSVDRDAAGGSTSPTTILKKKAAPPPPVTRRHSHHLSTSKPALNESIKSPRMDIESDPLSTRSSNSKPPPPPPSRRPVSVIYSPSHLPLSPSLPSVFDEERPSSKSGSIAPPPPPARSTSVRKSGKAPSIASFDSSVSKRSAAPPPPPPRQRASSRTSIDAGHTLSEGSPSVETEDMSPSNNPTNANDILASLNALQKDLDQYRNQFGPRAH